MARTRTSGTVRGRSGTGWDRLRGSWRVALVLARREAKGSPVRSLLIMALIAIPVFGLCAAGVTFASTSASPAELAEQRMGQAVAMVQPGAIDTDQMQYAEQAEDDNGAAFGDVESGGFASWDRIRPLELLQAPGFDASSPWTMERVAAITGSTVSASAVVTLAMGETEFDDPALVADLAAPEAEGVGRLVSGRWAQRPGEVTVTEGGIAEGLPTSGLVTLRVGASAEPVEMRIVGVARASTGGRYGVAAAVLPLSAAPPDAAYRWNVLREAPVALDEAMVWTDYGLSVWSKEVMGDPPPEEVDNQNTVWAFIIAMVVLGVFVETTFLAGPAFAISTTSRQRSLALASAQGAGPVDLRRQMLAYALVLATAASVLGGVLGAGTGAAFAAYLRRRDPRDMLPLEVPWLPLLGICVLAVGAATLAAWWPARAVTQLDTISVLRGRSVSRPVRVGIPIVGAVLIGVGTVLAFVGVQSPRGGEYALVAAAASTFFGMVLLIPLILFRLGGLGDRLPLAARLATRDATRQRGRSVPAVAAIVASVALVTGLSTVVFSSEAANVRNYDQTYPVGVGTVSLAQWNESTQTERLHDVSEVEPLVLAKLDDPRLWSIGLAGSGPETSTGREVEEGAELPIWATYPADCGADDVSLNPYAEACSITAGTLGDAFMGRVVVAPPEVVRLAQGIDDDAAEAVIGGAVLLSSTSSPGAPVHTVTDVPTVAGQVRVGPQLESLDAVGTLSTGTVKGYLIDDSESRQSLDSWGAAALMTPDTARDLGLSTTTSELVVQLPDRPISQAEQEAIGASLDDLGLDVYVERGAESRESAESYVWFITAVLGLIALAATIIVTALTTTDSARDSAVLSAIGGTNRLRRRWAASYAAVISTLGLGLGSLVGLALGAACAIWTIRGSSGTEFGGSSTIGPSALVLPWPVLGALLVLPVLGAAVAWITVRKAPDLLRPTI